MVEGRSLWWSMHGRNKRSVTIDLKSEKGRNLVLALTAKCDIPNCKADTAADCATDPQHRARGMVREVPDRHFGTVLQAGIVPHMPESPGSVRWTGPMWASTIMRC